MSIPTSSLGIRIGPPFAAALIVAGCGSATQPNAPVVEPDDRGLAPEPILRHDQSRAPDGRPVFGGHLRRGMGTWARRRDSWTT